MRALSRSNERGADDERFGACEHGEDGEHERVDVAFYSFFAVRVGARSTGVLETADQ